MRHRRGKVYAIDRALRRERSRFLDRLAATESHLEGDVACGGLFVATYHVLPAGTLVRLAFDLPSGTRVQARGEVKGIRDHDGPTRPGLAIAFVDAEGDMLRAVAEFCSTRAPFFFDFD